jgi:hypothetical protein
MDSGGREQRYPLPDWISHRAVWVHSGEPVLHCALRGKPALLAKARDSITGDPGKRWTSSFPQRPPPILSCKDSTPGEKYYGLGLRTILGFSLYSSIVKSTRDGDAFTAAWRSKIYRIYSTEISGPCGILFRMETDPKSRIQDLCSKAFAATDSGQIEPILTELRAALQEKVESGETWMALCARAAVEQDPKKLLELVSEINRLFEVRERRLSGKSDGELPAK